MRSVSSLALLLVSCASLPTGPRGETKRMLQEAVVGIVVTGQSPDWSAPWNRERPWTRRINGVVIEGQRILVEAQHLMHATMIEVEKQGDAQRFAATPALVDPELPLALLEVDNPQFWKGTRPLSIADRVDAETSVTLCRWLPSGQFERARGTITQVSVRSHYPAQSALLSLEISSSMKAAGWSEIALGRGGVVGLVSSASDDQLVAIAAPVLRQFVKAAEDEKPYRGTGRGGFSWQNLVNPATRNSLDLGPRKGGVLVRRVMKHSSVDGVLEPGDVLLEVAGRAIGSTGKFDHERHGKLPLSVLFTEVRPGEVVKMKVLRGGEEKTLSATLERIDPADDVIPPYQFDGDADFFEVGGLVFQPLNRPYLQQWKDWWRRAPLRLLVELDRRGAWPETPGERVIILNRVLPDTCNLGYEDVRSQILLRANGRAIKSTKDLKEALAAPQGPFHVFEFVASSPVPRLVLDAAECAAAEPRIHERYGLP